MKNAASGFTKEILLLEQQILSPWSIHAKRKKNCVKTFFIFYFHARNHNAEGVTIALHFKKQQVRDKE